MPRSAVELTTKFNTGESNRDFTAGLKMASHKTTCRKYDFLNVYVSLTIHKRTVGIHYIRFYLIYFSYLKFDMHDGTQF